MAKFFLKVAVQKANDKCEGHIKFVYGRRQESREASVICTSCGKKCTGGLGIPPY